MMKNSIENFIKEAKNGFYFDKTDSPFSLENHTYVMVTCIPETPNYDLKKKLKPLILIGFKHSRHYINLVMCYTIHN